MAMAQCPECGNEVSDRAPRCPHCGIVYDYGDAQMAMSLLNFMGSSIGISGDGYFLNGETAFVLVGNTYHGLSFAETPPVAMPILQNMFLVVGLMVFNQSW